MAPMHISAHIQYLYIIVAFKTQIALNYSYTWIRIRKLCESLTHCEYIVTGQQTSAGGPQTSTGGQQDWTGGQQASAGDQQAPTITTPPPRQSSQFIPNDEEMTKARYVFYMYLYTVCPRSSDSFYIVT